MPSKEIKTKRFKQTKPKMKSITSDTTLTQTMFVGILGRSAAGRIDNKSERTGNMTTFNGLDNNATRNAFLVGQVKNTPVSSFENVALKNKKNYLRQTVTLFK